MRIVCPICSATYEVQDALLAPGRAVRCTRCSEQWVPIDATPPPPTVVADEPPDRRAREPLSTASPRWTAMDRLASHPAPLPRTDPWLRVAWAASVVVLLLAGWGAIAWRADVMRAWPPGTRLYDAIGLALSTPPAH
jgi:predicted Zn finger-like uncharacterized protein